MNTMALNKEKNLHNSQYLDNIHMQFHILLCAVGPIIQDALTRPILAVIKEPYIKAESQCDPGLPF